MHELGVVFYIIRDVKAAAEQNKVSRVHSVTLEVGEVSGIVNEMLEDCWNWACKKEGPILDGCKMYFEKLPAITYCEDCKGTYETLVHGKTCPMCGSSHTYLQQGSDVSIKQIEAE